MKVLQMLNAKQNTIHSASPENSLCEVMNQMLDENISAVLIYDNDEFVGIISEKDILSICKVSERMTQLERKEIGVTGLKEKGLKELKVKEYMTLAENITTCKKDDTLESLMESMTEKRIRHIPVSENGKIIGIVSIGDAIKFLLDAARKNNKLLNDYITGAQV
ncbi:MAG: CBS domain-containing protein [Candidatus Delongbacteria bacterium]|jgi:CBS domain-containing protein|nr:CBS domain-containing protein [Candidatus Delongbacteria bacterium]